MDLQIPILFSIKSVTVICFNARFVPGQTIRSLFKFLYAFDMSPTVCEHFHVFCNKMSQCHLIPSLPQTWNQLFLQGGKLFRNQYLVLSMLITIQVLLLKATNIDNMYVYVDVIKNTFYMYVYFCMFIYSI